MNATINRAACCGSTFSRPTASARNSPGTPTGYGGLFQGPARGRRQLSRAVHRVGRDVGHRSDGRVVGSGGSRERVGGGTRFGSGRAMDAHWDDADTLVQSVGDSSQIQLRNVRPRRFRNPRGHQALHTTYVLFCSSSSIRIREFCVMNDGISPGRNCVMADVFAQRLTTPSMPAAWSGRSAVSWSTSSRMRWRGDRVLLPPASL